MKVDVAASAGEAHPVIPSTGPKRPIARWPLGAWVVGGAAIAAGVGLRFLAGSDLWFDEALTVNIAELPLDRLRDALVRDGAPPLYYVLLHGWITVFGSSDTAVRALSGILGVTAIALAYLVGRQLGRNDSERRWLAIGGAIVIATSPYAIRYSTETRMYALSMVLVLLGILIGCHAWEAATPIRIAAIALVTAGLLYTQYWSFFLVGVVGAGLLVVMVAGPPAARGSAARILAGIGVGGVLCVPWIPTLWSQLEHTGTPWDAPAGPVRSTGAALVAFAGSEGLEAWISLTVLGTLVVLAVVAVRATAGRVLAAIALTTLVLGVLVSAIADVGFQDRYAAVVFPFAALVIAFGLLAFGDFRIRAGVLAIVAVLGLVGGTRVVREERTASGAIAAAMRPAPGPLDLVAYCPDQLGPSTARKLSSQPHQVMYPNLAGPRFVDWTDYEARNARASPRRFAARVHARARSGSVWLVWSPGYRTLGTACENVVNELERVRPGGEVVTVADGPNGEVVELRRFEP